jgi:hypothetical protein
MRAHLELAQDALGHLARTAVEALSEINDEE